MTLEEAKQRAKELFGPDGDAAEHPQALPRRPERRFTIGARSKVEDWQRDTVSFGATLEECFEKHAAREAAAVAKAEAHVARERDENERATKRHEEERAANERAVKARAEKRAKGKPPRGPH